ncbi:hypothetical protein ACIBCR_16430 [Micromonospora echinospora]|uniref:VG15 protein n=1 Tax=Micromonospora echinospora TaxID=1877 RepID=UPI00379B607A
MRAEQLAAGHYRRRVALARRVATELRRLWSRVDRQAIGPSWQRLLPTAVQVLTVGQERAATVADEYVTAVLDASGVDADPAGRVRAAALAGVASDGRDLAGLLYRPAVTALTGIGRGVDVSQALTGGGLLLDMVARTQVADAGRVADGIAVVTRPQVTGYVRMLVGASCSRCVILAGRRYGWNAGFLRHPRCDCVHVPAREDTADEVLTNPRTYFDSLTATEQDRIFTQAGAQAIRDGADISHVVNARRGARGLTPAGARLTAAEARTLRGGRDRGRLEPVQVFGRDLLVTTEGTTTRGVAGIRLGARDTGTKRLGGRYRSARAPRLMPESIYRIADGDRDEAIRLLRRYGYIL